MSERTAPLFYVMILFAACIAPHNASAMTGSWYAKDSLQMIFMNDNPKSPQITAITSKGANGTKQEYVDCTTPVRLETVLPVTGGYLALSGMHRFTWRGHTVSGPTNQILFSTDLTHWTVRFTSTIDTLDTLGCFNGLFVAVGSGGAIFTSANGVSWDDRCVAATADLHRLIVFKNRLYAITRANNLYVSSDGTSWTAVDVGVDGSRNAVACSDDIMVIASDSGNIISSTDGTLWSKRKIGSDFPISLLARSDSLFIGYSSDTTVAKKFLFSVDGVQWAYGNTNVDEPLSDLRWDGGIFVAQGTETFFRSANGVQWNDSMNSYNSTYDIASIPGFVIPGSRDGHLLWEKYYIEFDPDITPFPFIDTLCSQEFVGFQDFRQYALYANGPTSACINGADTVVVSCNSEISLNGTVRWVAPGQGLTGVSFFRGTFIAIGNGGTIMISQNATDWEHLIPVTSSNLSCIVQSDSLVIAGGSDGVILTSLDGIHWVKKNSGISNSLFAGTYFKGNFYLTGSYGVVVSSSNGNGWRVRIRAGELTDLWSICALAHNDSMVIALSCDETGPRCLGSYDGVTWVELPRNIAGYMGHISERPDGDYYPFALIWTGRYWVIMSEIVENDWVYFGTNMRVSSDGLTWIEAVQKPVAWYKHKTLVANTWGKVIFPINDTTILALNGEGNFIHYSWSPGLVAIRPSPENTLSHGISLSQHGSLLNINLADNAAHNTITCEVYSLSGRLLQTTHIEQGQSRIEIPLNTISLGSYILRVDGDGIGLTKRFMVAR